MTAADAPLEVRRRPRTALAAWTVAAAAVIGVVVWFVTSPRALATSDEPVVASTPVGQDVYLAVASGEPDRTLELTGVRVHVSSTAPVEVEPLVCVEGSPRVTSDPEAFCQDLVAPEGHSFRGTDSLVLRVRGEYAGVVNVDRVRLGFREGVRWGTRPAGAPATVALLGR
ncbi:MAG TPA: hypothetical protein VMF51_10115 [Nocardioides sp.]|uniref:hypothetical protein n=1 Tax=Nocardioides sp. TaxID=35761 RepID=UPI002C5AD52C|nr:hypothetical protein [Nocardioides sp.]HTW15475.1 hypothetical protein [Nocardioides sp.]